jgi:ubiquinone biosynthesis protein COQ4
MGTTNYFGADGTFNTDSPRLISSSKYLNHAVLRDIYVQRALGRNHADFPVTADIPQVTQSTTEMLIAELEHIEALWTQERANNPALDAWFKRSHYVVFSDERLAECPEGSTGNLLLRFLKLNGFSTDLGMGPAKDHYDVQHEFFMKSLGYQHDLEHFLGGFGVDTLGEQGVTWMRHANHMQHLSPELAEICSRNYAFLNVPLVSQVMLNYPKAWPVQWELVRRGVLVGQTSEPLWLMDTESIIDLPPEEAREILGYRNVIDSYDEIDGQSVREMSLYVSEGYLPAKDPRIPADNTDFQMPKVDAA